MINSIFKRRSGRFLCSLTLLWSAWASFANAASPDTRFDHYTIALSWLPGFCLVSHKCKRSMTHNNVVGLHGAWPSEPKSLENAGLPEKIWVQRGCQAAPMTAHSRAMPMSKETREAYASVTADTGNDIVTHEAKKHLACLDLDPNETIGAALKVRGAFTKTEAAKFLLSKAGKKVSRAAFFKSARRDWPHFPKGGVVLRCRRDAAKGPVLVEIQLALDPATINEFPRLSTFTQVSGRRSSCPATFYLPDWDDVR